MTKDDVIRLARNAGFMEYELDDGTLHALDKRYERFANQIRNHALEEAAEAASCLEYPDDRYVQKVIRAMKR